MDSLENDRRKILLATVVGQLRFLMVLKNIKEILDGKNFSFIVLKGTHLGNTIYNDPIERLSCDLDLLVKPTHFDSIISMLLSNKYELLFSDSKRFATEKHFYCWHLISPQGVLVEIHRDLAGYGRYPINVDGLFERAEPFKINKVEFLGLGPEDLLLHLCLHMIKGYFRYNEKKHIEDIALLTKKRTVNWDTFRKRVKESRCSNGTYYALFAAKNQFQAKIPDEVIKVLCPKEIRKRWLDWHLDPTTYPIYRYSNHKGYEIQMRLGLMIMDKPIDWIPFLWKYSRIRFRDALIEGRPHHNAAQSPHFVSGGDLLTITVKIVSGVERSAIPDTIKMGEAAGRKLWGSNQATLLLPAAYLAKTCKLTTYPLHNPLKIPRQVYPLSTLPLPL